MLRIAVAVTFTCAIVLAAGESHARAKFRFSSPSAKPAVAAKSLKPGAGQAQKAAKDEPLKPFAAAKPAVPQPFGNSTLVVVGPRRAAAPSDSPAPQRAASDDAVSPGPLQFDAGLASVDEGTISEKKKVAASATECAAPSQAVAAMQPLAAKERAVSKESPITAPAPSRLASAQAPAAKPKRPAAPMIARVCYVQRDGTCAPSP